MPRPISWLKFLPEIIRTVTGSHRTHWTRAEAQRLFRLKERAAQQLFELLPREQINDSQIVKKEMLLAFLEQVRECRDSLGDRAVPALFEAIRKDPPRVDRRRVRYLGDAAGVPTAANPIPEYVTLRRGRLEMNFHTVEELLLGVIGVVAKVAADEEAFAAHYGRERTYRPTVDGVRGSFFGAKVLAALAETEDRRHSLAAGTLSESLQSESSAPAPS